ncbi:hypothetical protein TrST_g2931 [Triparma strigata]|uniref:Uncharacterized protein n=1 Tax=Triparma strigata TaxID=1606541 RepID=A0A9W7B5Y9_9STRA|nr:hypothetical protein TrST_g2931 [Triparma strigata]
MQSNHVGLVLLFLCGSLPGLEAFTYGTRGAQSLTSIGSSRTFVPLSSPVAFTTTTLFCDAGNDDNKDGEMNPIEQARSAAVAGNILAPVVPLIRTFPSPALLSISMVTAIVTSSSTFSYLTDKSHSLASAIGTTVGTGVGLSVAVLFLIEAVKKGQLETEEDDNRY